MKVSDAEGAKIYTETLNRKGYVMHSQKPTARIYALVSSKEGDVSVTLEGRPWQVG